MKYNYYIGICAIFFILFPCTSYAQFKIVKDMDGDGVKDSIFYRPESLKIEAKLSGRQFQPIYSSPIRVDTKVVGLEKTKSGFRFYAIYDGSDVKFKFRYDGHIKGFSLEEVSHRKYGPGKKEGAGSAKIDIATNQFTGKWKYFDLGKRQYIEMPILKEKLSYPSKKLNDFDATAAKSFIDKSNFFFKQEREKVLAKNAPPEQKDKVSKNKEKKKVIVWKGAIEKKIPIILILQRYDKIKYGHFGSLVVGKLNYLNQRRGKAIDVVGYLDSNQDFYLQEFDEKGNVLGIIQCSRDKKIMTGGWSKPLSNKHYNILLIKENANVSPIEINTESKDIFGEYAFQMGDEGKLGSLDMKKIQNGKAALSILTMTAPPLREISNLIDADVVFPKIAFTHKVSGTNGCAVSLQFFKDFVLVNYSQAAPCQEGLKNKAGYEGIYYKVK